MNRTAYRLAVICLLLTGEVHGATKRALLIEIGTYPAGRKTLHTARDRYWMEHTLHRQQFSDICVIQDNQATALGIRNALNQLIIRCRVGDKVIIHYGGHGTQLPDQNGDERANDKKNAKDLMDEALVPYDAPKPSDPARFTSDRYIRDDELGGYLAKLRTAVGASGHVLMLVDACHSGTLTRGQALLRTDNPKPAQPRTDDPVSLSSTPKSGWFEVPKPTLRTARAIGSVVVMAGARDGQTHSEIRDEANEWTGPLSLFFSQAMEVVQEQETYQSLFTGISQKLRRKLPTQNPTLEGDVAEPLLGGDLVLPTLLVRAKVEASNRLRLLKGMLLGYTTGSEVTVQVTRGDDVTPPLAGTVVESNLFESVVQLPGELLLADSVLLRTELLKQAFRPESARVTLADFRDVALRQRVETALLPVPGLQLVPDGADWLIRPDGGQLALCRAVDGTVLERYPLAETEQVARRIAAYAQADWLRNFEVANSAMRVSVTLIPVRLDARQETIQDTLPVEMVNGFPVLRTNQQAWLTVRNVGEVPFYFSVIDIQPDAGVSVGIPNTKYPAGSLRLMPGAARSFPLPEITPPLGLETYKLLLSKTPVNLRTTVKTRGRQPDAGSQTHPLTVLLSARLRGSNTQSLVLNEAGTGLFQFWIASSK